MEKINSILWVQHEDASKNGYLVINGTIVAEPDENIYHVVNRKLLKDFPLNIFDESVVKSYMKRSTNQYFQIGNGLFKGVAYRSSFLEKDKNGDAVPFLFWKSSFHLKGFGKEAIAAAAALGKTMDKEELKFVDKFINRIRYRRIGFCILVILIIVLITCLIQKQNE